MKTYSQAKKVKQGWANADNESMCSAVADTIALHCALNPLIVYAWIRKHYGDDYMTVYRMQGKDDVPYYDLVGYILEDKKCGDFNA
jgi:hypothetical protein